MGLSILIVDDEAPVRDVLQDFFKKKGHSALAVESGVLGLGLLTANEFDVLISDIKMPGMDGLEFARRAKKLRPDTVVLILTGYGSLESAQEAIQAGVQDYLIKPIDWEKLEQSVDKGMKTAAERKKDFEYFLGLKKSVEDEKQRLEAMKNELMTLISHELRTPISSITTGLSLIRDTFGGIGAEKMRTLSDKEKKEICEGIEKARRRLLYVVEDINYYLNLHRGWITLNKSEVEVNRFIEKNFDGLNLLVSHSSSTLRREFAQGSFKADIDKEKILDAIMRLIHNAAYHNTEGTEIVIRLSPVRREDKNFVRIEVCDNGQGMDARTIESVSSPFGVGNLSHHREGLGMSLSICRKVVELHGGDIRIESQKQKETKIIIELPAREV